MLWKTKKNDYSLHSRITFAMLGIAIAVTLAYVIFIITIVDRLENAMLQTLVGHEIDELVIALIENPDEPMPKTASVNAYLDSRAESKPIPEYMVKLDSNLHRHINVENRSLLIAILDLPNDRLYLEFDITDVRVYRKLLILLLVVGGIFSAVVLILSGFWLLRKFLGPVGDLASELNNISPDTRNVRIRDKFRGYEVGAIAESIDEYLAKLDEFVEREQSFTAAVSHELRTPVAVISTATDLLELKGIDDHQKGAIGRIKSSTVYMGKVIESLLLFVRTTHSTLDETLPEIELKPLFKAVVRQYKDQAKKKGVSLSLLCGDQAKVRMSESHVEIILGNLLRNAISNTSSGEINIVLNAEGFSVQDTGKGIDKNKVKNIVKLNYRDDNSSGYGVGLYLVTNICQYYGIELQIDSQVDVGSRFYVSFSEKILSLSAA